MEIKILKKDIAPTVEVNSTKERKQIYKELKEIEQKQEGKTKRGRNTRRWRKKAMNNYREMETSGDGRRWEKTKKKFNRSVAIRAESLTEWNNVEAQVKTKMRDE